MRKNFKFKLDDEVVETATGNTGRIEICGFDAIGITYHVCFVQQVMGMRRHWKREAEIALVPPPAKSTKSDSGRKRGAQR